jgi:Tfp pilus assembly ATPase PilU
MANFCVERPASSTFYSRSTTACASQQNVKQFQIGVVVIETFDTTLAHLRRLLPQIKQAVATVASGMVVVVSTAGLFVSLVKSCAHAMIGCRFAEVHGDRRI